MVTSTVLHHHLQMQCPPILEGGAKLEGLETECYQQGQGAVPGFVSALAHDDCDTGSMIIYFQLR